MKKLILILLITALTAYLCACNPGDKDTSQDQPASDLSDSSHLTDGEVSDDEVNLALKTAITSEADLSQFEYIYHWGDYGYEQNLIWCTKPITDVSVISVFSENAITWYSDQTPLYSLETLSPGEAINLDMMIPEGMPNRAFCFSADGTRYTYALVYNGRDGGISLVEIGIDGDLTQSQSQYAPDGFTACIYVVEETANANVVLEKNNYTLESSSAWHVWSKLKQLNSIIPANAYLNSFDIDGDTGYLDMAEGIYAANVGSEYESKMIQAISNTFLETYNLSEIYLTVNGSAYESGHITIDGPLSLDVPS